MAGLGLAGAALLAVGAVCLGSGCAELGYYKQSAAGHIDLMTRAKPVPVGGAAVGAAAAAGPDSAAAVAAVDAAAPPLRPSGEKKYDVAVHAGLADAWDERTYAAAKRVFAQNVRTFASCPEQHTARFSVEHILNPREDR